MIGRLDILVGLMDLVHFFNEIRLKEREKEKEGKGKGKERKTSINFGSISFLKSTAIFSILMNECSEWSLARHSVQMSS